MDMSAMFRLSYGLYILTARQYGHTGDGFSQPDCRGRKQR